MRFLKSLFSKQKSKPVQFVPPKKCMHLDWEPESRKNNWRSFCKGCGLKAQGSCQG